MKITPKPSVEPISFENETSAEFSLFQNRSHFHENIEGFKVYINQYAWDAFVVHANEVYSQTRHEAQGIFLGKYFKDKYGEFAVATEYSEGRGESSHTYVGMSEECVAEISGKCSLEAMLMLVWIHTHPNFGVFYSATDIKCLQTNFFMPFQSGIVVDIIRHESKGFKMESRQVTEFNDYYIYNVAEKRISTPYAVKAEPVQITVKKNEEPKADDNFSKEIIGELQSIKNELVRVSDIISKKNEHSFTKEQMDLAEKQKSYSEEKRQTINLQLNHQIDFAQGLEYLISTQTQQLKKYLFLLFLFLSVIVGLGVFEVILLIFK